MTPLEARLRERRDAGRKILAPYVTAGFPTPAEFPDLVAGLVDAGADMLEIGVPFSDPLMDGPVIQRASDLALRFEMRPPAALRAMAALRPGVPFVFMTYVNPVLAMGFDAFAAAAADAGALGAIVPDLPPEEGEGWAAAAAAHGLAAVFLAAPTTTPERVARLVEMGGGFVYCVSLLGVTGVRDELSSRAAPLVARVREATGRPALLGLGVSTPEQAAEACGYADGVIVGSAVIKAVFDEGVQAAVDLVRAMRKAIDGS